MNRRQLLRAFAAAPLVGSMPRVGRAATSGGKHLIVIVANGGWDTTYLMDPKLGVEGVEGPEVEEDPDDPEDREAVETLHGLPLMLNRHKRPITAQFFEDWGHRVAIVNGLWTGSIAHDPSRERVLSGSADNTVPDMVTIAGHVFGDSLPLGSVDMSGFSMAGSLAASSGRVGYRSQLKLLIDDDSVFESADRTYDFPQFVPTADDDAAVRDFLRRRTERLRATRSDGGVNDQRLDDLLISLDRAERFVERSDEIADFLNLGKPPSLAIQASLAATFLEQQLCHSVLMDTSRKWDSHTTNTTQHENYEATFLGLTSLITSLEERSLLDDTLVVVISEMTRTPKFNDTGGKDHWPHTAALMFGGGVVGGRVRGGTDDLLESLPMRLDTGEVDLEHGELCKYDNFAAGVLASVGVDPGEWFPGITPFMGALT